MGLGGEVARGRRVRRPHPLVVPRGAVLLQLAGLVRRHPLAVEQRTAARQFQIGTVHRPGLHACAAPVGLAWAYAAERPAHRALLQRKAVRAHCAARAVDRWRRRQSGR